MNRQDIWDELEQNRPPLTLEEEMFELVSAYYDGECSLKEQKLVEAYLSENAHASHLLEDLRFLHTLWNQSEVTPPPTLREAILRSTTRRPEKPRFPIRLAWAMGILVFLGGLWFFQQAQKPTLPNPERNFSSSSSAPLLAQTPIPKPAPADISLPPSPGHFHEKPRRDLRNPKPFSGVPLPSPPKTLSPSDGVKNSPRNALQASPTVEPPNNPTRIPDSSPLFPEIPPPPSKPVPEVPDLVALNSQGEGEGMEKAPANLQDSPTPAGSLSPEARSRLRKRLSEVNSTMDELREAVKSGTPRRS